MTLALCFLAAWLGFALLALGQARHAAEVAGAPPRRRPLLAGALLAVALGLCIRSEGWGFGILLWSTLTTLAALGVVATLTWRPRLLRPLLRPPGAAARRRAKDRPA